MIIWDQMVQVRDIMAGLGYELVSSSRLDQAILLRIYLRDSLFYCPPPWTHTFPRKHLEYLANHLVDPPGSRLPIHLHASTRAPTLQHVTDRVNLICAQNGLQNPARNVPALMALACEVCLPTSDTVTKKAGWPCRLCLSFHRSLTPILKQAKLKQLITHALTLTSTSHAISSIAPALPSSSSGLHAHFPAHSHGSRPPVLTPDSFHTLFTVSPADLPNGSAAAMRFAMGPSAIVSP